MHHHLSVADAMKFYPCPALNWPITTREAHALLQCMGLDYDVRHLAEFALDSGFNLSRPDNRVGRPCVWGQAEVEAVAIQLAGLGHFTSWASLWKTLGVPLATACASRAAACAAYGVDSWRELDIHVKRLHDGTATVSFSPRYEVSA